MGDQQRGVNAVAAVAIENQTVFHWRARHLQKTQWGEKDVGKFLKTLLENPVLLEPLEMIDDQIGRTVVFVDLRDPIRQLLENFVGDVCSQKTKIILWSQLIAKSGDLRGGNVHNEVLEKGRGFALTIRRALGAIVIKDYSKIFDDHLVARALCILS